MDAVLVISAVILVGTMIPGPSFLMVARTTLDKSRASGMLVALGMGLGSVILASLALAGLQALFSAVPNLYIAFKLAGGLYLLYLAYGIWRSSSKDTRTPDFVVNTQKSGWRDLATGLLVQVSNPKAAVIYGSLFAAFTPRELSIQLMSVIILCVFVIETLWYVIVVCLLSADTSRKTYFRFKHHINRFAGMVMATLGLRLIFSSR